ncbi:MAG: hypothetical protein A2Y76_13340 [Planctomycetes bacterium RBG_13_60_9]|nr:MAG: hypothetical protein A2Y76_13340 [Planctomycetes bacterium RBG_13_60_9]
MATAFISYSSQDEAVAKQLHAALSHAGIPAFLAAISIEPGEKWTEEIFGNLREATWVFFLASRHSCASPSVQQELGASLVQKKVIIPVLLDITAEELPGWVDRHQAIDPKKAPEVIHETIDSIAEKIKVDKFWAGVIIGAIVLWLVISPGE